jgi:hypothetical protein
MTKRAKITQKNYRDNKGSRCPSCHKFNASIAPQVDPVPLVGKGAVLAKLKCLECGSTWVAEYRVFRYDGLKTPVH